MKTFGDFYHVVDNEQFESQNDFANVGFLLVFFNSR